MLFTFLGDTENVPTYLLTYKTLLHRKQKYVQIIGIEK